MSAKTLTDDQRLLIERVVRKHAAHLVEVVEAIGTRPLTQDERDGLQETLSYEMSGLGFDHESDANWYGRQLDDLIDVVGRL